MLGTGPDKRWICEDASKGAFGKSAHNPRILFNGANMRIVVYNTPFTSLLHWNTTAGHLERACVVQGKECFLKWPKISGQFLSLRVIEKHIETHWYICADTYVDVFLLWIVQPLFTVLLPEGAIGGGETVAIF